MKIFSCTLCEKETHGTYSEGGIKIAVCEECYKKFYESREKGEKKMEKEIEREEIEEEREEAEYYMEVVIPYDPSDAKLLSATLAELIENGHGQPYNWEKRKTEEKKESTTKKLIVACTTDDNEILSFTIEELLDKGCTCYVEGDEEYGECGEEKEVIAIARHDDYGVYAFCEEHWEKFCGR